MSAAAWVLPLRGELSVAVGEREQVHLMIEQRPHVVAAAPAFCRHIVFWNNQPLPVLDLAGWVNRQAGAHIGRLIGIYAFQSTKGAVDFGGLWLDAPPRRTTVQDSMQSSLPKPEARWRHVASSCFRYENVSVPILDLPAIFNGQLISLY